MYYLYQALRLLLLVRLVNGILLLLVTLFNSFLDTTGNDEKSYPSNTVVTMHAVILMSSSDARRALKERIHQKSVD